MTPTNTEALAIAEALEKRLDCSSLVLTADVERAAAELRRLSAVEAERDALRADAERWRFALTQPYEFWKRIGFMGCAEDQNEAIDAAMKGTT